MGLFRSQDRFSKSDSRTREMKYVSKAYFTDGERFSDSGERWLRVKWWKEKERRKEGDWGGILFETSLISLCIVCTHPFSSSSLQCLKQRRLPKKESNAFTLTHRLQPRGSKGAVTSAPLWPAHFPPKSCCSWPRSCAGRELEGTGQLRAPGLSTVRNFSKDLLFSHTVFVAAVVHSTSIKGFRCL